MAFPKVWVNEANQQIDKPTIFFQNSNCSYFKTFFFLFFLNYNEHHNNRTFFLDCTICITQLQPNKIYETLYTFSPQFSLSPTILNLFCVLSKHIIPKILQYVNNNSCNHSHGRFLNGQLHTIPVTFFFSCIFFFHSTTNTSISVSNYMK